ncbi:Hairy and enhancer of split-related protein HELT [Heterocephalus glaber]|uniref:Hairy and enhancer of split-related protein HELT n=1 Tax=Heterocephalus glaber TaxID=10181 RepID=G5B2X2_HETGA|nr:Hairy and enhancer of split-related protein HELT [Heterocephalus glaber]
MQELLSSRRTPVSHKVIEKRRRDRINRCLNELGKTVPMALAKQSSGKLEKAEILEMTVQYLRALHSSDFLRGREKAELLAEFANYFHYGYHECMKNLVHYLTTVERMETKDTKYARILAFLQSKARLGAEPAFSPLASLPEPDFSYQLHSAGPEFAGHTPSEAAVFPQGAAPGTFPWPHGAARNPALPYLPSAPVPLSSPAQQHSPFLAPVQGLDRHYRPHPPQRPQPAHAPASPSDATPSARRLAALGRRLGDVYILYMCKYCVHTKPGVGEKTKSEIVF